MNPTVRREQRECSFYRLEWSWLRSLCHFFMSYLKTRWMVFQTFLNMHGTNLTIINFICKFSVTFCLYELELTIVCNKRAIFVDFLIDLLYFFVISQWWRLFRTSMIFNTHLTTLKALKLLKNLYIVHRVFLESLFADCRFFPPKLKFRTDSLFLPLNLL